MLKKIILFALFCLTGLFAYSYFIVPHFAQSALDNIRNDDLALTEAQLPAPDKAAGILRYKNIALDKDAINTIESLDVRFSLFGSAARQFDIRNIEIIASVDKDNTVTLDGFNLEKLRPYDILKKLKAGNITIRNADISLLTENHGLITTKMDITLQRLENGDYTLQGRFNSSQKYLTLDGNLKGTITPDLLTVDIELLTGKVTLPEYATHMSRMSGQAGITYRPETQTLRLNSTLKAGGLKTGIAPWQNAEINYTIDESGPSINIMAQALNIENSNIILSHKDKETSGIIAFPDIITRNNFILQNRIDPEKFTMDLPDYTAYFWKATNVESGMAFKLLQKENPAE
jgi:hypothetical protein